MPAYLLGTSLLLDPDGALAVDVACCCDFCAGFEESEMVYVGAPTSCGCVLIDFGTYDGSYAGDIEIGVMPALANVGGGTWTGTETGNANNNFYIFGGENCDGEPTDNVIYDITMTVTCTNDGDHATFGVLVTVSGFGGTVTVFSGSGILDEPIANGVTCGAGGVILADGTITLSIA